MLNRCNLSQVRAAPLVPLAGSLRKFYLTHNMRPLDLLDGLFTGLSLKMLSLVSPEAEPAAFLHDAALGSVTIGTMTHVLTTQ